MKTFMGNTLKSAIRQKELSSMRFRESETTMKTLSLVNRTMTITDDNNYSFFYFIEYIDKKNLNQQIRHFI